MDEQDLQDTLRRVCSAEKNMTESLVTELFFTLR